MKPNHRTRYTELDMHLICHGYAPNNQKTNYTPRPMRIGRSARKLILATAKVLRRVRNGLLVLTARSFKKTNIHKKIPA